MTEAERRVIEAALVLYGRRERMHASAQFTGGTLPGEWDGFEEACSMYIDVPQCTDRLPLLEAVIRDCRKVLDSYQATNSTQGNRKITISRLLSILDGPQARKAMGEE